MKVTNSLYENILCLTFENGFTIREVVYNSVRENKEKGVKIVWFGVSERGPKLKTTLHGDLLLMVNNIIYLDALIFLSWLGKL